MSESPEFQQNPAPDAYREGGTDPAPASPSPDQAALSRILRESVDRATEMDVVALASVEPLMRVARRRSGEAYACDPIAIELLEAALTSFFDPAGRAPNGWRTIAERVARSLCDDPITGPRLEQLWRRLIAALNEAPR